MVICTLQISRHEDGNKLLRAEPGGGGFIVRLLYTGGGVHEDRSILDAGRCRLQIYTLHAGS